MRSGLLIGVLVLAVAWPAAAGADERVRESAFAAGFGAIADQLAAATRPTIVVERERIPGMPRALGTTRFGGRPDLPADARWPRCRGRAQSFLGQVRLRDLPRSARPLRRHGGRLLFFTAVEYEVPEERINAMWAGDCSAVIHAQPGATLRRTPPPRGRPVMRLRPAIMRFKTRPDIPDEQLDDDLLAPPLQDLSVGERWEPYMNLRFGLRWGADWRAREHRLLGYVDQPNGYDGGCYPRTNRPREPWRHLFTIGWDGSLRFRVADGGRLQLAISPEDLRRGRFDRACGFFDSA
jgi:hypothetical protein